MSYDPSRTTMLRREYQSKLRARIDSINKEIKTLVDTEDAFGLIPPKMQLKLNAEPGRWRFLTSAEKVKEFDNWFKIQVNNKIFEPDGAAGWATRYVQSAYQKGFIRSFNEVHPENQARSVDFYLGTRAQFLRDAFNGPIDVEKLKLLYTRNYEHLDGITDTMAQQIANELVNGFSAGQHPRTIARNMTLRIQGLSRTRAMAIARTEIMNAHAEGQLDAFEFLGIEELMVLVEWGTAGDSRVCKKCAPMEGVVFTLKQARGLIPRHPNCRCVWLPAFSRGSTIKRIGTAVRRSVRAEHPGAKTTGLAKKLSRWRGADLVKSK